MRKLLALLMILPCISFAKDIDVGTVSCRDYHFNQKITTLQDVKDKCMVSGNIKDNGRQRLTFTNASTDKKIHCYFADDLPTAKISYCE